MTKTCILGLFLGVLTVLQLGCPANNEPVVRKYTLTVNTTGQGTVTPGSGEYEYGEVVNLSAVPAPGWHFFRWTSTNMETKGRDSETSVMMDSSWNLTAEFIYPVDDPRIVGKWEATYLLTFEWDFDGSNFTKTMSSLVANGTYVTGAEGADGWRPMLRTVTSTSAYYDAKDVDGGERYKYVGEKLVFESTESTLQYARPEGEVLEGEVLEGEVLEGEVLEGEVLEGEVLEGEVLEGEVLEGGAVEG